MLNDFITGSNSSDSEAVVAEERPARPNPRRGRGRGSATSVTGVPSKPDSCVSSSNIQVNSELENSGALNAQAVEGDTQVSTVIENDHSVGLLQATVAAVASNQEDVASFMRSTKSALTALFTILTMAQLRELEISNEQEIVDNDLLKTCVNEAKSAIKIRIGVYKDNLDKARNKPANEEN